MVRTVVLNEQSNAFLVVLNFYTVILFQPTGNGGYQSYRLMQVKKGTGYDASGFQFAEGDGKLEFLYTLYNGKGTKNKIVTVDLHHPSVKPQVKNIRIYLGHDRYFIIHFPMDNIYFVNHKWIVLFSKKSTLPNGDSTTSIFHAEYRDGQWRATRISTTEKPSENAVLLHSGAVLWTDFKSYNHHQLEAASQDPVVIANSLKWSRKDWGNAFSRMFSNTTISLLIFFLACLWGLPAGIFLIVLFVANMTMMERNPPWVKYTAYCLFGACQLIFIQFLFKTSFYQFGPDYLTFTGSSYIVPIILLLLSWFLMTRVKGKEWENIPQIIYAIGLDVLMIAFLIGPYVV